MKILVVKLTSMGDVLHLMPALTDLQQYIPEASVDWMVEDSFSELPPWHPLVNRVISVSTRRWRKPTLSCAREFISFVKELRSESYDMVIDAQGLIKSAVFARMAKVSTNGVRAGFSGASIKESPAAMLYQRCVHVSRDLHAIMRLRKLFAGSFGYQIFDNEPFQYAIKLPQVDHGTDLISTPLVCATKPTILLLHGTTWASKHLPDQTWRDLADLIAQAGYQLAVCWGNETERQRAEWIAQDQEAVQVLPKSTLRHLANEIQQAVGVVAVDTGLGHMAAALSTPAVSVYGSTNAGLTGALGEHQVHLQSDYACSPCLLKDCNKLNNQITEPPCYQQLDAQKIWHALQQCLKQSGAH